MTRGPVRNPPAQRRRRNAAPSDAVLPPTCALRPPKWPLGVANEAQAALWRDLWHRPVAQIWHAQRIPPSVVARYVALATVTPTAAISGQLMALENALALTPAAMARLRLRVEEAEPDKPAVMENIEAARRRLAS